MAPSPIPAPLPPWARALLQLSPLISAGLQFALEHIGTMNDNTQTTNSEWRHVQCVFEPVGSTEVADRAITTFDIVNITGGTIDNSWTDQDYTDVEAQLTPLITGWCSHMQAGYRWIETNYYRRSFNPYMDERPFTKGGPPERKFPHLVVGSDTAAQARQIAFTTTDRTAYPRHWGRNYWPWPGGTQITSSGYITDALVDAWGASVNNAYWQLAQKEFFVVTPVTQVDNVPTRGLLTTSSLQMDNVPDVVRRRRNKATTHRYAQPTP